METPQAPAYIGRLAPSPTGLLHLGHAATFLRAYDRAHAAQGTLYLRLDDLDPQRSKELFAETNREDMRWLGITWVAELRQSQRLSRYREALQHLLDRGAVYPCVCSRKDLQRAVVAPHEDTEDEPVYNNRCRPQMSRMPSLFQPATNYRFRVVEGEPVRFTDGNFGPQEFIAGEDFGDFLVWRKDGLPSYQLATVVDDADLHVTEVVRGRDLLKSTARQMLVARALDVQTPAYFHTDLLRDAEGERLAKRHDALSLASLRAAGVSPAEIRARVGADAHHNA